MKSITAQVTIQADITDQQASGNQEEALVDIITRINQILFDNGLDARVFSKEIQILSVDPIDEEE